MKGIYVTTSLMAQNWRIGESNPDNMVEAKVMQINRTLELVGY
jgi:hypothetical protein